MAQVRTPADVEADIRKRMAEHAAISDRGWQTHQQRAILRERIDRLLDELAMRRDVAALVL